MKTWKKKEILELKYSIQNEEFIWYAQQNTGHSMININELEKKATEIFQVKH